MVESITRKPKVLVTASSAFPRWKGDTTTAFVYDLSRQLAHMGFEVVALAPHHPGSSGFESFGGIRVHRFRYFLPAGLERLCYGAGILPNMKTSVFARLQLPFFVLAELFALLKVVMEEKPDIIHAHWILPQGFTAAIIGRLLKIPVVVTAHAGDVFPLKSVLFRLLSRFSINSAAAVTVNSSYTKAAVEKIAHKAANVIPMGVDMKLFSSSTASAAAAVRRRCGVSLDDKMILFVGRLAEKKGVTYLVSAMAAVVKKFPDSKLVVVGDGPEKAALQLQVQHLGLSGSVIFAGSIPNPQLPPFYRAADVFVLPSIVDSRGDTEGLGVVLLEAVAAGTPVVASRIGGISDVVIHNGTGLLAEQKNHGQLAAAIVSLLKNRQLAKKLSAAAKRHVEAGFSWKSVSDEFAAVYGSVLHK